MPNEHTSWLVMVYISADGLLANFAVESLKQLKRAAGNGVVVVARLGTDGISPAKRYVFEQDDDLGPLVDTKPEPAEPHEGVTIPSAGDLSDFINKAVETAPQAEHHALFLWGHGPELLSEEEPKALSDSESKKNPDKPRTYLTPSELRDALKQTRFAQPDHKLDIVGLDACSMSMAELASELGDYVQFMVASQDDVPDQSFPYEVILRRLKEPANADAPVKVSTMIPEAYREAYRDYLTDPRTGFRAFTLSVVNLGEMRSVTDALKDLAADLLQLSSDATSRQKIFEAREQAKGFDFGLFVDIVDLCEKLKASNPYLNTACDKLQAAVSTAVIKNEPHKNPPDEELKADGKAQGIHGLSIYFPYRVPDVTEQLQELRKGGSPFLSKGGSNFPSKGGSNFPSKERSQRIHELERDFARLQRFSETCWMKFIQEGWSSILTEQAAKEAKKGRLILEEIYSAQQCAQNLGSARQDVNAGAGLDEPTRRAAKSSLVKMPGSCEQPPAVNQ
jgi:hypothetical protein